VSRSKYEDNADCCIKQREKRKERSEVGDNIMKKLPGDLGVQDRDPSHLTLGSLFRFDPAIDQLLQHIERDAAVAQHHFMELTDIKFFA
jgi:hypothetical protein